MATRPAVPAPAEEKRGFLGAIAAALFATRLFGSKEAKEAVP